MIGNEEPQYTEIANVQLNANSHKLPEMPRLPPCSIPRPFDVDHLMKQWQPMGIRVVVNTPFTGDDSQFLFAIRNGPFIPSYTYRYQDSSCMCPNIEGKTDPDLTKRQLTTLDNYQSYGVNNMLNVVHGYNVPDSIEPKDAPIIITQYDEPPILSSLSTMFRKWRGTMHYRVRVVSGFTTQGYVICTYVRNSIPTVGIYQTQSQVKGVQTGDFSYRPNMLNSYIMGDVAMFRHFEVEAPFEYPVPFYDQYNWIGNRSRPASLFGVYANDNQQYIRRFRSIRNEPHGDNYLLFGLRGNIEAPGATSQVTFELEYRAGDDFQFSDPFLPFDNLYLQSKRDSNVSNLKLISSPSTAYTTDGLHGFNKPPAANVMKAQLDTEDLRNQYRRRTGENQAPMHARNLETIRSNRRPKRELGYDTVDDSDLESEIGDTSDVLDLKRNLRKSLQPLAP